MNNLAIFIFKIILLGGLTFKNTTKLNLEANNSIGKIEYVVNTELVFKEFDGYYTLFFDEKQSYFYNTSMAKELTFEDNGNNATAKSGDEDGFPLYKNFIKGEVQQKYEVLRESNKCIITDILPKIKWNITKDTKKISNFMVQKAIGSTGGRTYEVWYTTQISVSNGPFKLQGLPGMILEAKSLDGKIKIAFKSYEKNINKSITPITKLMKIPNLNHSEYLKQKEEVIKKTIIEMKSRGINYSPPNKNDDWQIEKGYL